MNVRKMKARKLSPAGAAQRMGAYSHGVAVPLTGAELIFVTGQIAMNEQGEVVAPGDAARQAEYVFEKIGAILSEAGASFAQVVKAQIFLTDIADFAKISPIRNRYFAESEPASTLVEVSRLVKEGCVVEIEVIAAKPANKE